MMLAYRSLLFFLVDLDLNHPLKYVPESQGPVDLIRGPTTKTGGPTSRYIETNRLNVNDIPNKLNTTLNQY